MILWWLFKLKPFAIKKKIKNEASLDEIFFKIEFWSGSLVKDKLKTPEKKKEDVDGIIYTLLRYVWHNC